jgi:hypothetical protein
MITFLKTSEEAICEPNDACQWVYVDSIPEVTNMTTEWDDSNQYWTVVVNGTGFTGTPETTELNVNGKVQTTTLVNDTTAIFRINNITGWVLANMNVYFDSGLPKGFDTVIQG